MGKPWSKEECALLSKYISNNKPNMRSTETLADLLGRSTYSVIIKANRMGLNIRSMSEIEIVRLKAWYEGFEPEIGLAGLAREMGRTESGLCTFAAARGWTKRTRQKPLQQGLQIHRWIPMPMVLDSFRNRARKLYELPELCEECKLIPPVDRHHKDGNPKHNQPSNIAYLCRACHMLADGRMEKLKAHSFKGRFSAAQVKDIRDLASSGMSYNTIAPKYEISPSSVGEIVRRETYKNV